VEDIREEMIEEQPGDGVDTGYEQAASPDAEAVPVRASEYGGEGEGGEAGGDWSEAAGDDLLVARDLKKNHPEIDLRSLLAQVIELRERQSTIRQARQRAELVQSLRAQEDDIRRDDPGFDLTEAIRRSPAFRALILSGEPIERALNYIEPERLQGRIEAAILEKIRRRNERPQPIAAANARAQRIDPRYMSEEELRRIDERVKRGERIVL